MNGQDVITLDHDRCIFQRRVAGAIDHPHVGQSGDSQGLRLELRRALSAPTRTTRLPNNVA